MANRLPSLLSQSTLSSPARGGRLAPYIFCSQKLKSSLRGQFQEATRPKNGRVFSPKRTRARQDHVRKDDLGDLLALKQADKAHRRSAWRDSRGRQDS